MTRRFADTSLFVAFLNPADEHHAEALEHMAHSPARIVTALWVLIELGNYVAGSQRRQRFVPFFRDLTREPRVRVVRPGEALTERALKLYDERADKEWSLTDCLSFVVMKEERIREALTTDYHFEQAGFTVLLK